jgi:microcystin degradation protein MlrC
MRLFFAMLGTETNTFSPIPTGWGVWRDTTLRHRSLERPSVSRNQAVYQPLFERLDARGWELAPGLQAFAAPAGVTPRPVYEALRDELLADLDASAPIDAVMLFLHGAMVAEGYDDCEGDLLTRVRERVGPQVPIGAELDLHCHLTETMCEAADVLVGFKHYPHTDTFDRLLDLFEIIADAAEGKVRPTLASADCRMIGMYHTTRAPMSEFVDDLYALETQPDVLNAWLAHGFPYGDVPSLGTRTVVVTDDDPALAQRLANRLRDQLYAIRTEVQSQPMTLQDALDVAFEEDQGPITIADTADNTGGGAPGDSTYFLQALLERPPRSVALGPLYDPGSVAICHDAGAGAVLRLRIGGKLCADSGCPVDVAVRVLATSDRVTQLLNGGPSNLGACAAIRILREGANDDDAFDMVICSRRTQAGSPELFTELGVDPETKHLIIVKSTQHFHASFAPISKRILYAGDQGALQGKFTDIPYQNVATERYWPFGEPFSEPSGARELGKPKRESHGQDS